MRIPINLAREPFRRDRPMLVGSAFTALLLLGVAGFSDLARRHRTPRNAGHPSHAHAREPATGSIRNEQAKLDASMRLPGNEVVLDRSVLINTLIKRKAISWTKIFADLDKVPPPDVRILAIRPTVNAQGRSLSRYDGGGRSPEPVIGFISQLEGSDVFGSTAASGITPPSQTNPFYRYRLSVNYAQKL